MEKEPEQDNGAVHVDGNGRPQTGRTVSGALIGTVWLTVQDAASYAAVSADTIYTACELNELRHTRIGGRRSIRIKVEWIDAWLEQHTRGR